MLTKRPCPGTITSMQEARALLNVFVTGATGFIGGALCRRLLVDGMGGDPVHVICLVRDPARLPGDLRACVRTLTGRMEDVGQFAGELAGCAYVFHVAADASIHAGEAGAKANVDGTRALIAALAGSRALRRLVFVSSIGAVDRTPGDDCSRPLDAGSTPHPLTVYGRSKRESEDAIAASGLPYSILRPPFVYGPEMRADSHIRKFLSGVIAGSPALKIDFPGSVSTIHVRDLVDAMRLVAVHAGAAGQTYFATDGTPRRLGSILAALGRIAGREAGYWRLPAGITGLLARLRPRLPFALQLLFSDLLVADASPLNALGWKASMDFDLGLLELARWHGTRHPSAPGASAGVVDSNAKGPDASADRACVVTGAASGIGRALALQLWTDGYDVILVDRSKDGLDALARITGSAVIAVDLASEAERARLLEELAPFKERIDWIVNCAGVGRRGELVATDWASQKVVLDVNVDALVFLSQLAGQWLGGNADGVLVNIASSAAFQPLPYMATYAASKAFVLSFSESFEAEVAAAGSPMRVLTVCPSGTATGFQAAAGVKHGGDRLMEPAFVAGAIRRAAYAGRRGTVLIGASGKVMSLLARVLPRRVSVWLWRFLMKEMR